MSLESRTELRKHLNERFSLEELRELSFELGIDFESLSGDTLSRKTMELIAYMERRGQLIRLIDSANKIRPNVLSPDVHFDVQVDPNPGADFKAIRLQFDTGPNLEIGQWTDLANQILLDIEFVYTTLALLAHLETSEALIRIRAMRAFLPESDRENPSRYANGFLRLALPAPDLRLHVRRISYGSPLLTDLAGVQGVSIKIH